MTAPTTMVKPRLPPLTEKQWLALIKLLGDDDAVVFQAVQETLISQGHEAVIWLKPLLAHADPILRRHAREIVQFLECQEADISFLGFCINQPEDLDIEQGAWLLARTQYSDINITAYQALLDSYAFELRDRLAGVIGTEPLLAVINEYLFKDLGFCGNETDYYNPENSFLNRVLDRRTGNPISLCLVYLLLTRRLRLPVTGIGMPGHFICRYQTSIHEIYVDVFFGGKLLTKAECIKYLIQSGHGYLDGYLAPVTPRRLLLRICANLHQIYVDLNSAKDINRLQRYIVALSK
jgi:regulator of sirC expression with transglutaminase-like and TPR domain